jgi:hypothetical protein
MRQSPRLRHSPRHRNAHAISLASATVYLHVSSDNTHWGIAWAPTTTNAAGGYTFRLTLKSRHTCYFHAYYPGTRSTARHSVQRTGGRQIRPKPLALSMRNRARLTTTGPLDIAQLPFLVVAVGITKKRKMERSEVCPPRLGLLEKLKFS